MNEKLERTNTMIENLILKTGKNLTLVDNHCDATMLDDVFKIFIENYLTEDPANTLFCIISWLYLGCRP